MSSKTMPPVRSVCCAVLLTPAFLLLSLAGHEGCIIPAPQPPASEFAVALDKLEAGRETFRNDTFGSEEFWGGALRLHEAIAGSANGGVGAGLPAATALELGLKVDVEALPQTVVEALQGGSVDLSSPDATLTLLRADAVVGVRAFFNASNQVESVGITCALCHSTVDNSLLPGIGRRLDGWANRDLNVGAIVALAPNLQPIADVLDVDVPTVQTVLASWGPGKFDAQLLLDGQAFRPDGQSAATLIPPAFGLAGVNLHTSTGWGSVTYWNAFVAVIEMHGRGNFIDPRLADEDRFPVAARNGFDNIRVSDDRVTPKLADLHLYQLALSAPTPPPGSFDAAAAQRGAALFSGKADCARCHVPPLYTEPGWNMHTAEEIGIDDFQAQRSPDGRYRTAPLRGLWTHADAFYHDGRFRSLTEVIQHYNQTFNLALTLQEVSDLEEFLMSL